MQEFTDTITAQITPPGCGGVGIVRISGPLVSKIAKDILVKIPKPRYATFSSFFAKNNSVIDEGIALYFSAPNSFTGEDVLELQCHGGQVIVECLLNRIVELGARIAKPGEFSERAFLNNRIDLTQAEAIIDLINASTKEAANNAVRSLQGEFSKRVSILIEQLTALRVYLEAAIDFSDEEIDFLSDNKINDKLITILEELQKTLDAAEQGMILNVGVHAVIAGKPNAGKSSLLNKLSGQERAIVTDIPGTTRDVLHAKVQIDGLAINLLDTAGLRDNPDAIESEGIRRAWEEINKADHLLIMVDAAKETNRDVSKIISEFNQVMPEHAKVTVIFNKIDLSNETPIILENNEITSIYISLKNNFGLDLLKQHLKASAGYKLVENSFSARPRHISALKKANTFIKEAQTTLKQNSFELVAENLHLAQQALGEITGEFTSEDLLSRIFSQFCIGK